MTDKITYFLDAWEMNGVGNTVAKVQDGPGTVVTITVDDLRALLAAGASEGQAEPIYQIRSTNSGTWHDVDKERYYSTRFERRIVYTHDLNNRVLALEASHYLKDAEIAALRERIAGMEKDAQLGAYVRRLHGMLGRQPEALYDNIDAALDKEPK